MDHPAAALFWFLFAVIATTIQYLILPVYSTDRVVSVWVIIGLPSIFLAPIVSFIFSALGRTIRARVERAWPQRILRGLLATVSTTLLLSVVASPFLYFVYTTQAQFELYPTALGLPVEKAAAGNACEARPVLALISDTHITDQPETIEHQTGGKTKLERTLRSIRNTCPQLLIVTGDLTDLGDRPEWEAFDASMRALDATDASHPVAPQVLLVPGNHDLQGTPFNQGGRSSGRALPERRMSISTRSRIWRANGTFLNFRT